MRIDDDPIDNTKSFPEHNVRRFPSNSRKLYEFVHGTGNGAVELIDQCRCTSDNIFRLVMEKTGGMNEAFEFSSVCCGKFFHRFKPNE